MRALAILSIVAAPGIAAADDGFRLNGELSTVIDVDKGSHRPDIDDITLLGLRAHLTTGTEHVRYAYGFDGSFGFSIGGFGLAYDVAVMPIGFAIHLHRPDKTTQLELMTGIGASGSLSAIDAAASIPVELNILTKMDKDTSIELRLRSQWLLNDTNRAGGSPTLSFVDELDGMAVVQFTGEDDPLAGKYFGFAYREQLHAHFIGIVMGWGGGEEMLSSYAGE